MKINRCQISLFTIGFIGYIVLSGFQKETVYMKENHLIVNDSDYFETRGLNYFVFSNIYDATFDDSKISAVEIIHHGIRTATNGDVRLNPTPGQWDKLPRFIDRNVDQKNKRIILAYIRRKHYLINCVALPDLISNLCLQCFGDTHTYLMTYTVCFQLLRQIS